MIWITPAELAARRAAIIRPAPVKKVRTCKHCRKSEPQIEFRSGKARTCNHCLYANKKARQKRYIAGRNKRRQAAKARGEKRAY